MKDIFALEVSVEGCKGAILMVVAADSFPEAVVEADKTYAAWWAEYRTTPRGISVHADMRSQPGLVNVVLARRYRSDTRYAHVSRGLAGLINGSKPAATPGQIEDARAICEGDDGMAIDDDARVSVCEDKTVWVQAWLRVENPS